MGLRCGGGWRRDGETVFGKGCGINGGGLSLDGFYRKYEDCVRIHVCYDGGYGRSGEHGILGLGIGFLQEGVFFLYDEIFHSSVFLLFFLLSFTRRSEFRS